MMISKNTAHFFAGLGPLLMAIATCLPKPLDTLSFLGATLTSTAFYYLFKAMAEAEQSSARSTDAVKS